MECCEESSGDVLRFVGFDLVLGWVTYAEEDVWVAEGAEDVKGIEHGEKCCYLSRLL